MINRIQAAIKAIAVHYYSWRFGRPQLWSNELTEKVFGYKKISEAEQARLKKIEEAMREVDHLCMLFKIDDPTMTYPRLFLSAYRDTAIPDQEMEDEIVSILDSSQRRRELFTLMRRAGDILNYAWDDYQKDPVRLASLENWLATDTP